MSPRWPPAIQQGWFVIAESRHVAAKPIGSTFMGCPIVLVRLPAGGLTVFEDRCPHRQYPLSAGRLTPQGLQCGYHGWTFGADGHCTKVPGLPEGLCPKVSVRRLHARDVDGLIWVRALPPESGTVPELPNFILQRRAGSMRFTQRFDWKGAAFDALENFMDPLHTHFIHPGLVRRDAHRRPVTANLAQDADGITVTYEGRAEQSGLLYRLFESPRVLERAHHGVGSPGSACLEYRYRDGSALFFTLHFTPQDTWKTQVFATLHVEGRWAPTWAVRALAWPFLRRIAQQDRGAVERQAWNKQRFDPRHDGSTELDVVSDYLRSVWQPNQAALSRTPSSGKSVTLLI